MINRKQKIKLKNPAIIQARENERENKLQFLISYFGMKYLKNNTPDRDLFPPDEDKFIPCEHCNGTGKIMVPPDDEEEVGYPEYETCDHCAGEGQTECEYF